MKKVLTLILIAALATSSCSDSKQIEGLQNESLEQRRELEALTEELEALRGALEAEQNQVALLRRELDGSHHYVLRRASLADPCWRHEMSIGWKPVPEWCPEMLELDSRVDELDSRVDELDEGSEDWSWWTD